MSLKQLLFATALVVVLAPSVPVALADSVIYLDRHDVVAASPDGATKRVLTTNGTEESSYRSPSADDSGRWLAAREGTWYWHAPNGKLLSADLVDKGECESLSTGPVAGRLDPSGDFVAFESLCSGFAGQDITSRVVLNFPGRPTLGNAPVFDGYRQPTWMGNRLVVDGGNGSFVQDPTPEAPVSTAFSNWLPSSVGRAEVSRDRRRALLSVDDDGPEGQAPHELWLARLDADPPVGRPTAACKLPVQGIGTRPGFSPDGARLVWHDDRGVVTAPAYEPPPAGTERVEPCPALVAPTVLSPTGSEPSFTAADLHIPVATPTPTPTAEPERLSARLPARSRVRALIRGLALQVTVPAQGRVSVRLTISHRMARRMGAHRSNLLAIGSLGAGAAGPVTVRIRARPSTAAILRRLRRLPVRIEVAFQPNSGPAQTVRIKGTLR